MADSAGGEESRRAQLPSLRDVLSIIWSPPASPQSTPAVSSSPLTTSSTERWPFRFGLQLSPSTPLILWSTLGFPSSGTTIVQSQQETRSANEGLNHDDSDLAFTGVPTTSPATLTPAKRENDVDDAALDELMNILQGLHDCSKVFGALKAAKRAWLTIYTTVKKVTGRSAELRVFEKELAGILSIVQMYYKKLGTTYALNQIIDDFCQAMTVRIKRVENLSAPWTDEDKDAIYSVMKAFRNIGTLCSSFQADAQPHIAASILSLQAGLSPGISSFFPNAQGVTMHQPILTDYSINVHGAEPDIFQVLKDHHLPSAEYDSQEPLYEAESRTDIIGKISGWADSADDRPICWLYGPAGSGKSIIAREIATLYHKESRLAGSFFFSRGYSERQNTTKLITTIAFRLGTYLPAVTANMRQILGADPSIPARSLKVQLDSLIMTPIRSSKQPRSLIVVIDALDECNANDSIEAIEMLAKISHDSPPFVRFLITGRADDDLLGNFVYHSDKVFVLDLEKYSPGDVVHAFYRKQFEELFDKNLGLMLTSRLKKPWPTHSDLRTLTGLSNNLFIHAATLVKFVGDFKAGNDSPMKRLARAMERHDGLDDLYKQVLQDAPNRAKEPFARVIGALLLLNDPLSVNDLACLLRLQPVDIFISLSGCRSILRIPDGGDDAITFFHASLRDFLLNREHSDIYYIDSVQYHTSLLDDCIRIMMQEWNQKTMWTWSSRNAGRALVYACDNWHYHLGEVVQKDGWADRLRLHFGMDFQAVFIGFLEHLGSNWFRMWAAITERDHDMWTRLKEDLIMLSDAVKTRSSTQLHDLICSLLITIDASSQSQEHQDIERKTAALVARLTTAFGDIRQYIQLLRCHDSKAQAQKLLDTFQTLLSVPWLNERFRRKLIITTRELSKSAGLYPTYYQLKKGELVDMHPADIGNFPGEVYKGSFLGHVVCVKVVRLDGYGIDTGLFFQEFSAAAISLSRLSHANLVPIYGHFQYQSDPCFISPWMDNGDLKSFLDHDYNAERILLALDVASGLEYLHSNGVIHGDLQAVKILVSHSGVARIADFGLPLVSSRDSYSSIGQKRRAFRWHAPELVKDENEPSSKESDVYAFSCVCYEIFTGNSPFFDLSYNSDIERSILSGNRPSRPALSGRAWTLWGLTNNIWSMMEACWREAPLQRPTMQDIMAQLDRKAHIDDRPAESPSTFTLTGFHGFEDRLSNQLSIHELEAFLAPDSSVW